MEELIHSVKLVNLLGDESVQSIRCSICLDYFERPVVLACGHTFCFSCIKDTADHALSLHPNKPPWYVYLNCPQCRKPTNAYQASKSHVPVNYTVASLVHALKQVNIPSTNNASTITDHDKEMADSQTETDKPVCETNEYVYAVGELDKMEQDIETAFTTTVEQEKNIIDDARKDIKHIIKTNSSTLEANKDTYSRFASQPNLCNSRSLSTAEVELQDPAIIRSSGSVPKLETLIQ